MCHVTITKPLLAYGNAELAEVAVININTVLGGPKNGLFLELIILRYLMRKK